MADSTEPNVSLTNESLNYLKESSGWGGFMAIVGFCVAVLFIGGGLFAGSIFSSLSGTEDSAMGGITSVLVGGVYVCLGALYLLPTLYLYRFSQEIRNAINRGSTGAMTTALGNLKSLFKFMGIFTAIYLVVVVLGLLVMGSGMIF